MRFSNLGNCLNTNMRLIRVVFLSLSMLMVADVSFAGPKDCYTCNPDYVPGSVVDGNKTLGQLSEISLHLLSDFDSTYMGNLYGHCMEFPGDVRGAKTLRKRLLLEMEKTAPNGKMESYFLEAGCNPENLGSSRVTISQIAAELPSVRLDHLEAVRKYFIETKKEHVFAKTLNAKNTRGHTTLDYLHFLVENRKISQNQINASAGFKKYLCDHGAVYAVYGNETCDAGLTSK